MILFSPNCFNYKCLTSRIFGNRKTQTLSVEEEQDVQVHGDDCDEVCDLIWKVVKPYNCIFGTTTKRDCE